MKIIITGRHFDVSDDLSQYAERKISRLDKYFHRLIDIEVILYMEKHDHVAEVVINGDGVRFHGKEKAGDMYSSVDLVVKNMEKQAVKHKEKHSGHKAQPLSKNIQNEPVTDDGLDVLFYKAENKPKDTIEAFLEMKMDNRDFILFKKLMEDNNSSYSIIYRSEDGFRMAESSQIKKKKKKTDNLQEFNLVIRNDSSANPKIKLKKCKDNNIKYMALNNAIKELMSSAGDFVPFYNNETSSLNIIYKNGKGVEIMVPPA
jgi:putative sigma-54 modulation protein